MTPVTLTDEAWEDVDPGVEALVDRWLVQEGDAVEVGQPLANAVLLKTNFEITAPATGTIAEILVQTGETFARGTPIATLLA